MNLPTPFKFHALVVLMLIPTFTASAAAPTATNLSAAETYTEDTPLDLVDIVASDVDSTTITATLTLSNPAAGSLSTATSNAVTSTYSAGTGVWTASGPIADVNTLLAGVIFTPAANFNGSFTITTSVDDGALSVSGSKSVTGIAVNDAPVLDASKSPTLGTVSEDPGVPSGAVGTLISNLVDFASVPGGLDNVSDIDSGALLGIAVTASNPSGTVFYSLNGGVTWSAVGVPASSTNALLLAADADNRIYFQPSTNVNGTIPAAITFRAWDRSTGTDGGFADTTVNGGSSAFSSATDTISLTVTAVNDAPTATNLSASETYTEDTPLDLVDIVASDVDSSTITATLTLSNPAAGSLSTATSNAVTSTYSAGTGVWTASGAIADVNTLLAGVIFTPTSNYNGSFTIATSVDDGSLATTGSKSVTGIAVNDAPILDASKSPTLGTVSEDPGVPSGAVGTLISNLVDFASVPGGLDNVTDVDSGAVLGIAITASNPSGTVFYSLNGGVTWSAVGVAVSTTNALLLAADADNRIYFQPSTNVNGTIPAAFTFRAWDRSTGTDGGFADTTVNGGSSAFSSATDTVSLTVTAVNDAPTATNLSASETYTEDTPLDLVDIVASDVDSSTITATLTLSDPAAGSLSTGTSNAVTSTYSAGTGVWTASGAIADVNTLLAGVIFTPAANFNGSFTITTSVDDGALATTGSKSVTGIAVNDAPVLDASKSPTLGTVSEDPGFPSGAVGTLISNLVDFASVPGGLDNVSDIDSGALLGIAVTASNPSGTVFYSLNGGVTWSAVGVAVSTTNALLLAADGDNRIYFQPSTNVNGTIPAAITFRAWDRSTGTDGGFADTTVNGGSSAFSSATDTVSLTVSPVNDAPSVNAPVSVSSAEDTVLVFTAGNQLSVSDVDNVSLTITVSVTNGTLSFSPATLPALSFTTGDGTADTNMTFSGTQSNLNTALATLSFTPDADFNGTATLTLTCTDGIAAPTQANVALIITPVADAVPDAVITNEDTPIVFNAITGTNGASADNFENTPSLTSVTQGSNGAVIFASDGSITYTPNADFSGSDSFTYTVTSGGATETGTVDVTVVATSDVTVSAGDVSATETDAPLTVALSLNTTITDVDGSEALSYVVVNFAAAPIGLTAPVGTLVDNGAGNYTLTLLSADVTSARITLPADYFGAFSGSVVATSNEGSSVQASFNVSITGVNDVPKLVSPPSAVPSVTGIDIPIVFSVLASDVENVSLTYAWTFSDNTTATGAQVTHSFASTGTFTASVIISDGIDILAPDPISVSIVAPGTGSADFDQDGFSDEIEIAQGSDPFSALSVPSGAGAAATATLPFTGAIKAKLNFATPAKSSLGLSGALSVPANTTVAGNTIVFNIGGLIQGFTLDTKGKATSLTGGKFTVSVKDSKKGDPKVLKFNLKITSDFNSKFADEGLLNETIKDKTVTISASLLFNATLFIIQPTYLYKAVQGKAGAIKLKK